MPKADATCKPHTTLYLLFFSLAIPSVAGTMTRADHAPRSGGAKRGWGMEQSQCGPRIEDRGERGILEHRACSMKRSDNGLIGATLNPKNLWTVWWCMCVKRRGVRRVKGCPINVLGQQIISQPFGGVRRSGERHKETMHSENCDGVEVFEFDEVS